MSESKERIDALVALMEEYGLTEAVLEEGPFRVAFRKHVTAAPPPASAAPFVTEFVEEAETFEALAVPSAPVGTPIASPMAGIFYDAPNPTATPFVKEGDTVTAGQVVGLIEAMKVFNEIPSPVGGTVRRIVAEGGSVVNVGDTLILIG